MIKKKTNEEGSSPIKIGQTYDILSNYLVAMDQS